MGHHAVTALANDARVLGLAKEWLGSNAIPFRATLFEKSPDMNWLIPWHQDTALPFVERFDGAGWGPWSEKAEISYAHAPGWALARVIAMRPLLIPSSSKARSQKSRRVLHIEYADSLDFGAGMRLAIA